jgi:hypothetical protein
MTVSPSDVGIRREDKEEVLGTVQFCIVVDTGMHGGFLECQTDWRTPEQLRDYAARIIAAVDWLEAQ